MRLIFYSVVTALLVWPSTALAAFKDKTPVQLDEQTPQTAAGGGSTILRTLIGMLVVLAVIYGFYRALSLLSKRQSGAAHSPAVELVSRTALDRENSVYVIRSGDQVSVLAVGSNRTQLLRQLPLADAHAEGLMEKVEPTLPTSIKDLGSALGARLRQARAYQRGDRPTDTTVASLLDDESKDRP